MRIATTKRLQLCHLTLDDAEWVLELVNDADYLRHIGDKGVRTLDDARNYLATGPIDSYERHGFGLFRVELLDGSPIGTCGLLKRDWLDAPDVGYAFLPAGRRQGYAYEAARASLDYGVAEHGMRRVLGICSPGNAASIRLLEKLGMRFERIVKADGDDDEANLYVWEAGSTDAG